MYYAWSWVGLHVTDHSKPLS